MYKKDRNRQLRGKAKDPVEFGAKLDMSLDENGMARLERLSFDAYNECETLQGAVERYHERTGRYPERVFADKIYRRTVRTWHIVRREVYGYRDLRLEDRRRTEKPIKRLKR